MESKEREKNELRVAVRQLNDRCLYSAAKWAAEQLIAIKDDISPSNSGSGHGSSNIQNRDKASNVSVTPTAVAVTPNVSTSFMEEDTESESDFYLLAKSYFNCKEYRRAAHVLRDQSDKKAVFLRCYSLFLFGEKRKDEEVLEMEGKTGKGAVRNRELTSLERELFSLRKSGSIDPFGLYLYGRVLREKGDEAVARDVLVDSVNSYPLNWNAWSELVSLCTTVDTLTGLGLDDHWVKDFFLATSYQELRMPEESLAMYDSLQLRFGRSNYIRAHTARALYSLREFDEVESIFETLLKEDPYRVDDTDMYSNVLYAKECFPALSHLAHRVFTIDKYRPESCCIIGNYYSLKGQHEKSVIYFRRALKLNGKYLSAWTLMGHEYVEMKNTPAAVQAYRRAVDINPCDYRAWYGLGQAYEMLCMPVYALHYFRKAVFFQPGDSRLWIAMAQCYESERLDMPEEAVKCYKRAAECDDSEGVAVHQLAKLNGVLGRSDQAAFYYKKDVERMLAEDRDGPNMVEALLFLAKYCKERNWLEEAEVYCTRLLDYTGPEKETAKSLLRGMRVPDRAGHL